MRARVLWFLACHALASSAACGEGVADRAEEIAPTVGVIFSRSCAECHDAARRAKPKGGFGHVLDLPKLAADAEYIAPGEPEASELYRVLVEEDPDLRMPPPESDAPALSEGEKRVVRDWITALGAGAAVGGGTTGPRPAFSPAPEKPSPALLFARTHPMLVHFPVALLLVAALAELVAWTRGRAAGSDPAVRWCLGIAALAAPVASAAGWLLADAEGYGWDEVARHRMLGLGSAALALLAWLLAERARRVGGGAWVGWAARIVLLLGALVVGLAGHTGGELVYGEGYPFR